MSIGRIAQRESVPFTRERSKVRSLVRPPQKPSVLLGFLHLLELVRLAVIGRTEPKLGTSTRGKSVECVLGMFVVGPLVQNEKQSPMPDVGVHIGSRRHHSTVGLFGLVQHSKYLPN